MNQKNTNYLLKKYPKLYAQYNWDKTQTCMCWGFDVRNGWFKLIDGLSKRITKLDPEGKIQASQTKEKFGGLRFYIDASGLSDEQLKEVRELINIAETKSFHICEECGKKGKLRDTAGWYKTLCERHYKQISNPEYLLKQWAKRRKFRHEKNTKYKVKQ